MPVWQSRPCLVAIIAVVTLASWTPVECLLEEILSHRHNSPTKLQQMGFTTPTLSLNSLARVAGLGPQGGFRFKNADGQTGHMTAKGVKRVRLIQTYAGYDVFGSSVEAEVDHNGKFTGHMYGEIVKNLHKHIRNPRACQRKVKSLQDLAIRLEGWRPSDPNIDKRDGRRIIFAEPDLAKAKLAYKVQFFYKGKSDMKRPLYFFDACTASVLLSYDQVRKKTSRRSFHIRGDVRLGDRLKFNSSVAQAGVSACAVSAVGVGGNLKIGQINYNSEPFCLNVVKRSNKCTMEGTYSKVVDNEQTTDRNRQSIISFPCDTGYSDPVNGAYGVANDAFYYGEISGRIFTEKYDMRALPWIPRMVVHYDVSLENAYWDGTDMYFGDGATYFHPFVDIDTVAHELSHGVTNQHSDLVYRGIPGGINEAFSDICGETTKHFMRNSNDWLMDYDIIKSSAGFDALRYFDDPRKDGVSIKYVWEYRPFMDVHYSSGVFNHAFYAMVAIEEMNIFDAFKCFLDANVNLWKPFTRYFSGACNVMQAAYDNGFNHRKVRRAFLRVGIPLIFCNFRALTTSMYAGEKRQGILVSSERFPIFKVELDQKMSNSTSVEVVSEDNSTIQVVIGSDDEVAKVIAQGENSVTFPNSFSEVYVQLRSVNPTDVKVEMLVK